MVYPGITDIEREELRTEFQAASTRWQRELQAHLQEHEDAANGKWPANTMICDHVGGYTCQSIEHMIAAYHEQLANL